MRLRIRCTDSGAVARASRDLKRGDDEGDDGTFGADVVFFLLR